MSNAGWGEANTVSTPCLSTVIIIIFEMNTVIVGYIVNILIMVCRFNGRLIATKSPTDNEQIEEKEEWFWSDISCVCERQRG